MAEDTLALGRPRSGPLRSPRHPRQSARAPRRNKSEVSLQLAALRDKTSSKQRDDFDVGAAGRVAKLMQKKATKLIFPHGADSVAESRKDADTSDRSGGSSTREGPIKAASSSGWMASLFPSGSDADADAALVADAENLFGSDAWATEVAMHAAVDEGVKKVFDEAGDGAAADDDPPVWVAGLFPSASDEAEAVENKNAAGDDVAAEKVFEDATAVLKDIQSHERAASVDSLEQILGAGAQNAYHRPARKKWSVGNGSLFHGLEADEMQQTPPTMYDLASRDMEKNLPKIEKEARTEEAKAKAAKIKKMLKKPPREEKKEPTSTIMDLDALDLNVQSRFERLASSLTEDDVSVTDDDEAEIDFIEEMDITFGGKAFDAFAEFMANQWESLVEKE